MDTTARIIVPLLSGGLVAAAFADGVDPYADYIKLTASDGTTSLSTTSWNRKGNWDIEGDDFLTDANYYVPADKTLVAYAQGGSDAGKWLGGPLVIGGVLNVYVNGDSSHSPSFDDITFLSGSKLRSSSSYGLILSSSTMKVLATAEDPLEVTIEYKKNGTTHSDLLAAVYGNADAGIWFHALDTASLNGGFRFGAKTFPNFFGTVKVSGAKTWLRPASDSSYPQIPGKLIVTDSAIFSAAGYAANTQRNGFVGTLEVTNNGMLRFANKNSAALVTLTVTNSLKIADARVQVDGVDAADLRSRAADSSAKGRRIFIKVMNLTADAVRSGPEIGEIRTHMVNDLFTEAFDWKVFTEDRDDGTKDVFVGVTNIATCVKTVSSPSMTDPNCWAGGVLPEEGNDLYLAFRFNPSANWNFANSKLIFDGASSHYWNGNATMDLNAKAYYALGSCGITLWGANTYKRRWRGGPLTIADGVTFTFTFNDNCPQTRIESEIRGNGNLSMSTSKAAANKYRVTLENINTNWHGRLTIRGFTNSTYTYNTILGDARNWGGAFLADEDTYSAVTLASNTCVYVTNNVCFNDPTRGFLLREKPQFKVQEGFTLTLSNQVTYAGVVTKSDAGVLELGGTARFVDGQAETAPVATSNELVVAEGALKVSSKEACDGLAVSFAEGTKLVIPAQSADGLYDVKWDAPLASSAADGKVAVEIDTTGATLPELGFATTIATLNATAAEDVPADFFKVARVPGYKCIGVTKRTTDAGVAYDATFEKRGMLLIMR